MADVRKGNICIFIDNNALNDGWLTDEKPDLMKVREWLADGRGVGRCAAYCGEINNNHQARSTFYGILVSNDIDVERSRKEKSDHTEPAADPDVVGLVNCNMAWGMYRMLTFGRFDRLVLVSGHNHLSECVAKVKQAGVEVDVVFHGDKISPLLRQAATTCRAFSKEDMDRLTMKKSGKSKK